MSVLSTITGSLPNVLNLLQGGWDVQYKKRIKDTSGFLGGITAFMDKVEGIMAWINGQDPARADDSYQSLDFDSFVDMQEIVDTSITKQAIEGGSFRSVNKVRKPRQIKVTLAKAGIGYGIEDSLNEVRSLVQLARYDAKKTNWLSEKVDSVKNAVNKILPKSLEFNVANKKTNDIPLTFRVLTPFDMITNLNLVKLDYTFKKDTGRNMLLMYLTFEEILEVKAKVEFTKERVSEPTYADGADIGRVSLIS